MSIYKGTTPITPTKNIEMSDADLQLLTDEVDRLLGAYPAPVPQLTAYATAQSGITYTPLADLTTIYTSGKLGDYADAIAANTEISNTQETVYIHDGDNHYSISVGATYSYELSTNEAMTDRILGFRHDILSSDHTSKAGITFQMVDCLATRYPMNSSSTNAGGWNTTKMRTETFPTIKGLLPSDLQSLIKIVDKTTANGGGSGRIDVHGGNYSEDITTQDDLFLLSGIEIFGSGSSYGNSQSSNEGARYKYWVNHNTNADRIKYYDNAGSRTATYWWERSSHYNVTNSFCSVYTDGNTDYYIAISLRGISFAYCIGGANE